MGSKWQPENFCKECEGWGVITVDAPRPRNFNRDIGYISSKMIKCPECGGTGEKEKEDEHC